MFDLSNATLKNIVVHKIGSKYLDEGTTLSKGILRIDQEIIKELLLRYFLSTFKKPAYYQFTHEENIELNEVFTSARDIFTAPGTFFTQSIVIAKHLYENSDHPQIKEGEFYMVHFDNCISGGEETEAIGLFKSENKETYLKVGHKDEYFEISYDKGINIWYDEGIPLSTDWCNTLAEKIIESKIFLSLTV